MLRLIATVVLLLAPTAAAQCVGQWLPGQGPPGISGSSCSGCQPTVAASTLWDPDGPGPLPERLVIGGSFSLVGSTPANNIATWDGAVWSPLGAGLASIGGIS